MDKIRITCKCCNVGAVADGRISLELQGWYHAAGYKWVCGLCKSEEDNKWLW